MRAKTKPSTGREAVPDKEIEGDEYAGGRPPQQIVKWQNVGVTFSALLASLGRTPASSVFARFAAGALEPLRLLEYLEKLAKGARLHDKTYIERFAAQLHRIGRIVGAISTPNHDASVPETGACYHCRSEELTATTISDPSASESSAGRAVSAGYPQRQNDAAPPADARAETFHEAALTHLLAAAIVAARSARRVRLSPPGAAETITALVRHSALVTAMVRAHAEGGREGLLRVMETARAAGMLESTSARGRIGATADRVWPMPAPMSRMLSGNLPSGFDLPDLGGIEDPLDLSPPLPEKLDQRVAELIRGLLRPSIFDPEQQFRPTPWLDPPMLHDPFDLYGLQCFYEYNRISQQLNEPPPPAPSPVVWNTGIASVELSGRCSGDKITIRGSGFGSSQPAGTALLLPTLDGCRSVAPTSWSDTRIEAILPARVASGPVGFGDAFYIALYDAWAARMRVLEDRLASLECGPPRSNLVQPFGTCPPVSAINVIAAGTPEILAFLANGESLLVLEDGQSLELTWTVNNAHTIVLNRLTAAAPAFAGSSTLVAAPGQVAQAFGAVHHLVPEEWTYELRATGACGAPISTTVKIVAAKRPALRIASIQITQSIQTPTHSVPLVATKPTVVRVLVKNGLAGWGGGNVPGVEGRLRMYRPGQYSQWIDAAPVGAPAMVPTPKTTITVGDAPSTNNTADTLNFILPTEWCTGTANYIVEVRVAGFGATPSFPGFSDWDLESSVQVTYAQRKALQLRYILVNWNNTGPPPPLLCEDTLAAAVPLLPTPFAGISQLAGWGVVARTFPAIPAEEEDEERRDMLNAVEDEHNCSSFEAAAELLGYECPDDDGAIWVLLPSLHPRGEAHAVPSNVCFTPLADGPYAAHELSHCLNQVHVRMPTSGPDAPRGGVAASAWPNFGMLLYPPFDTRGTTIGWPGWPATQPRALSLAGVGVWDVMTYMGTPNNTWPSPERWQNLWDYIGP